MVHNPVSTDVCDGLSKCREENMESYAAVKIDTDCSVRGSCPCSLAAIVLLTALEKWTILEEGGSRLWL